MFDRDWFTWHDLYDTPNSKLARRLAAVREQIAAALDDAPPGPLRAISLCAGQGRDLIGALAGHPRAADVHARLVELDERNVVAARTAAQRAGLPGVEVIAGDAAEAAHYLPSVPADLVLLCGILGNLTLPGVARLVEHCTQLCGTGGSVVWTRHREVPDPVPWICDRFDENGFEQAYLSDATVDHGVGRHRFLKDPQPLPPDTSLFTFVGHDRLINGAAPWWT